MAETPNYAWPPREKRRQIGKSPTRIDGPAKASGKAKYSSDVNLPGMLHAALLTCPHAHARITAIDTSAAEKSPGVAAVHVISPVGTEIQWSGTEVAAVAATTENQARDAARQIKVQYEVLPHVVREEDLSKVGNRAKAAGEQITGDPDQAFKEADVVSEGEYGIPVVAHSCLEPHGGVLHWQGDKVTYWPSTQFVSGIAGTLAPNIKVPVANIRVHQEHIGGGFGSKFGADRWDAVSALLSQKAGGKPVKLFLDRATELNIAGNRPSAYSKIKLGAKKDGTITVWQSQSWASGGFTGGGMPPTPYVYTNIPNKRINHTSVSINAAGQRAWRAPNSQQASYLTCSAIEDLAAALKMDPMEVFAKNAGYTPRAETYRAQLAKAAELSDWKRLWHQRGDAGAGPVKRGLGIGVNAWGGGGHASQCRTTINPDGSVMVEIGVQDLGTGTRTVINQVAAETLGLPLNAIAVRIGDNSLPPSGASGGSTTVGGVSSSTRKSCVNALAKLFDVAAPALGLQPDQLEVVDGRIQQKDNPAKSITWQAACRKMGTSKISEMGANDPRNPGGLNSSGVGGIQVADVSVDTETGIVKLNKFVAVQDCGLIINPKLAESQCYGGIIMGICTALYEERVMDPATGIMLNHNYDTYKLAGIGDIGEIVVHLEMEPQHDSRGVIGLGEPPAIGIQAAIGNAVANALGVRVRNMPMTPDRVLAALERRNA
ncbi:MAG TPA: xanthine dehydrogenase family protein molybdopterin-binding subunit [Bryobacteraceae bacterium]|nr:xanthine dehydrogenase family protein molybdopterin-binding subunit [Bryobacteraceae bacterium]